MRLRNSSRSWGLVARVLHWIVAVMIVVQFATGWLAENESNEDASLILIRSHFQFGMVLGGLILMRILWRLSDSRPCEHIAQPRWQTISAEAVHGLMYVLFIILPVSGYIVWVHMKESMDVFGLFTIPRLFTPSVDGETLWSGAWYVHYFAGWALIALACTHIAAALWHQFIIRDGLIRRMTTGQ
ncbi:cytochrome b [Brevundimonas sp.]